MFRTFYTQFDHRSCNLACKAMLWHMYIMLHTCSVILWDSGHWQQYCSKHFTLSVKFRACIDPSSQAKVLRQYPLPLASLKMEAPAAQFNNWMWSKPIASNQTICNKKSSLKQKTIIATIVKNERCTVFDENLPKKSKQSIFNEYFFYSSWSIMWNTRMDVITSILSGQK